MIHLFFAISDLIVVVYLFWPKPGAESGPPESCLCPLMMIPPSWEDHAWRRLADKLLWSQHHRSFLAWLRHAGQEIVRSAQEAVVYEIIHQI